MISGGVAVAIQVIDPQQDTINWVDVGIAAGFGAVSGGLSAIRPGAGYRAIQIAGNIVISGTASAVSDIASGVLHGDFCLETYFTNMAREAAFGVVRGIDPLRVMPNLMRESLREVLTETIIGAFNQAAQALMEDLRTQPYFNHLKGVVRGGGGGGSSPSSSQHHVIVG